MGQTKSLVKSDSFFQFVMLLVLSVLVAMTGCSVHKAVRQPDRMDLSVLEQGTPRGLVIGELGQPVATTERDGKKVDIYNFVDGYRDATKVGRAVFHGAADVFTLGLWEIVANPIEDTATGTLMTAEVVYDQYDRVESATIREGTFSLADAEAEESGEAVAARAEPNILHELPQIDPGNGYINSLESKYYNSTYSCRLDFAQLDGWVFFTQKAQLQETGNPFAIFAAENGYRFLGVILMVEDVGLEMSNADYQFAFKRSMLAANTGTNLEELGLETRMINGNESVVWTHKADYEGQGIVSTQAFFQKDTSNYTLMIFTPEEAFERRSDEITAMIESFDFLGHDHEDAHPI